MTIITKLKEWAKRLRKELTVIYLAYQDARTPWNAKAMAFLTVAYALSPIDIIPDFIPIIGYLDDLILVPLGIYLSLKMIPSNIIEDCRIKADAGIGIQFNTKLKWIGLGFIIFIWFLIVAKIFW